MYFTMEEFRKSGPDQYCSSEPGVRGRVRSLVTWKKLRVEPLLLHIEARGHTGGSLSLGWPGNFSGTPQRSCVRLCSDCCLRDPTHERI